MKALDVWPSNSMVALGGPGGDEPVAVMIGTKREREVLVHRLGVRPGHERRGHGSHLVTSLSQKLAVLGPGRLVAEVPEALPAARALLESLGWTAEDELVDRRRPAPSPDEAPLPPELAIPVTVADLEADGALDVHPRAPWARSRQTLRQAAERLRGAAIATPERIEAWVLWWDADDGPNGSTKGGDHGLVPGEDGAAGVAEAARCDRPIEVAGAGCRDADRAELLLGVLFRSVGQAAGRSLLLPRLADGELDEGALRGAGFEPAARTRRYAATARPL